MEEWQPALETEIYTISSLGRVCRVSSGRILKPQADKRGRPTVVLSYGGRTRRRFIHHLVLEAFVGPCPQGLEACHWDDDKQNNRLENLRWDTRSSNRHDQVRNGRHPMAQKTHCVHGHSLADARLTKDGKRRCRQCETIWRSAWRAKRRE